MSWSFCTVGLTSVSPITATAPPPWRWSSCSSKLGLPGNWKPALLQLMASTTGSSVLFELSSPMSLMLMPGFAQLSRLPWSRCTNRKRPAFSSLTTWSRPSVQGVAGRRSSSGIAVPSLKRWMSAAACAVLRRVTTWPRERSPARMRSAESVNPRASCGPRPSKFAVTVAWL